MTMKIKLKMKKNRSQRYKINRLRRRLGNKYMKCNVCLSIMMFYATFETRFMKTFSNTKADLKVLLIKKACTSAKFVFLSLMRF